MCTSVVAKQIKLEVISYTLWKVTWKWAHNVFGPAETRWNTNWLVKFREVTMLTQSNHVNTKQSDSKSTIFSHFHLPDSWGVTEWQVQVIVCLGNGAERRRGKSQKALLLPLFFFNFINNLLYAYVLKTAWSFISMVYLGYLILFASGPVAVIWAITQCL